MLFSRERRLAMKVVCRVLLLAPLCIFLCSPVSALEILYPLDGTYVSKSNYLIIKGGQDPFLDGVAIEINGVKSEVLDLTGEKYRALFADMLLLEPSFDPGENKIVVDGYVNGERFAEVASNIFYQEDITSPPPIDYRKEVFHFSEREAFCVDCHKMSPSAIELSNPDPRRNPCASCHARMLDKEHVHGPAGVYDCTYCHDISSEPNKYQPRVNDGSLCLECHEDMFEEHLKAEFVHGPVEAGLCMACHDPHASNEPAQLVLPAYELCSSCHDSVLEATHVIRTSSGKGHPLKGVTNPVGKGEDLSCASCHDPHSSVSSSMFRWGISSRMSLCVKCHKK